MDEGELLVLIDDARARLRREVERARQIRDRIGQGHRRPFSVNWATNPLGPRGVDRNRSTPFQLWMVHAKRIADCFLDEGPE